MMTSSFDCSLSGLAGRATDLPLFFAAHFHFDKNDVSASDGETVGRSGFAERQPSARIGFGLPAVQTVVNSACPAIYRFPAPTFMTDTNMKVEKP